MSTTVLVTAARHDNNAYPCQWHGIATAIVVSGVLSYTRWRKTLFTQSRKFELFNPLLSPRLNHPDSNDSAEIQWLDEASFSVFSAMIDALIPSLDEEDITRENVQSALAWLLGPPSSSNVVSGNILDFDTATLRRHTDYYKAGAIDANVHHLAAGALQNYVLRDDCAKLHFLFSLMSTSIGCFLLTGNLAPFQDLPLKARVAAMYRFKFSSLIPIKAVYQTLKRITGSIYLSYCERGGVNPNWASLGYDPSIAVSHPVPASNNNLLIDKANLSLSLLPSKSSDSSSSSATELSVDVVVVGSGTGGGTLASELVKAGLNVLVLEKGGYYDRNDFKQWRESEAFPRIMDRSGLVASSDGNIMILAGSCVGGGSTVNWSASFRTPTAVLDSWSASGLAQFRPGGAFHKSLDAAHRLFGVNDKCSHRQPNQPNHGQHEECKGPDANIDGESRNSAFAVNGNNVLLWEAAEQLGLKPEKVPRNVKQCVDCGHCCHGCPYGSKNSTMTNLMAPLLTSTTSASKSTGSLRIIANCHVERVLTEKENSTGGYRLRAVGVEGTVSEYPDTDCGPVPAKPIRKRRLIVHARIVVASGGALHTPALLLRSQLNHPLIGRHLALHPVAGVGGMFSPHRLTSSEGSTQLASGVSMGVVVKPSHAYGIAVETPPLHPGLFGVVMPWFGGLAFKFGVLHWRRSAVFIGISRDRSSARNRVVLDRDGQPVVHYELTKEDEIDVMDGVVKQLELMYVAGANVLFPSSDSVPWFLVKDESNDRVSQLRKDVEFATYVKSVRANGLKPFQLSLFSAHQMSSCRMAADRRDGPVQPTGETFECRNLFVADGSLLPSSLGINPMITIAAMGHFVSREVMKALGVKEPTADHDLSF